jgi:hypothetical protein
MDKLREAIEALAGELEATAVRMSIAREERQFARDIAMKLRALLSTHGESGEVNKELELTEEQEVNLAGEALEKIIGIFRSLSPDGVVSHELEYCLHGTLEDYGRKVLKTAIQPASAPEGDIKLRGCKGGPGCKHIGYMNWCLECSRFYDNGKECRDLKDEYSPPASAPEGWRGPWRCEICGWVNNTPEDHFPPGSNIHLSRYHYRLQMVPYDRRASDDAGRLEALRSVTTILLEKCDEADSAGDLPENIDGAVLDLLRQTLYPVAEKKGGEG